MKKHEVFKYKRPLEWGLNMHKAEGEPKAVEVFGEFAVLNKISEAN